jgi:hypothetical protein
LALLCLSLCAFPVGSIAQDKPSVSVSQKAISSETFSQEIAERIERVPEFKFIREEAARLGVKAYLFGGTAAGYAHYVKWDMQREAGDKRFQPDRFDYDYTNIFRSTQDLDIVVDGSPEKAAELQAKLAAKFPHFQGSKTAWEVRLLRQDMGDKQALLNNPDFLNQHTDSNSTGMIEISKPTAGEPVIRDLRDWGSKSSYFLRDVIDGKIHYYFSPSHDSTTFAKEGRNPPIISVIRFLTKAFQYELEIRPEDLKQIQAVIDAFKPRGPEMNNSYVRHWLLEKDNGRKLIQNAVNIEYAWNTLEKLGLRKKLISIENNPGTIESLAWWMNKEPLRTQKLETGFFKGMTRKGRTARALGLDIVAHETNSFLAYESITRAHTGDPNVLISRVDTAGEGAAHGNGFYTRIGREGARGTGLTIRFHLSPDAREGSDFTRAGDFVIVHNKSALRVIPESLNLSPVQYFEMLSEGKEFSNSDLGLLEKLKRRTFQSMARLSPQEQDKLASIVRRELSKPRPNEALIQKWFSFRIATRYPEIVEKSLERGLFEDQLAKDILTGPEWKTYPMLVETLIKHRNISSEWIARELLRQPHWKQRPELIDKLIDSKRTNESTAQMIFNQTEEARRPQLIEKLLNSGTADNFIAGMILTQPEWKNRPEFVARIIERKYVDPRWIAKELLQQPDWKKHPELLEKLIDSKSADRHVAQVILSLAEGSQKPRLIEKLLNSGTADGFIAENILTQPEWKNHPEFVAKLIDNHKIGLDWIAQYLLTLPHWKEHPELIEKLIDSKRADPAVAQYILSQPEWRNRPDLIKTLLERGTADREIAQHILTQPEWKNHPELVEKLFQSRTLNPDWIPHTLLQFPHWKEHPELVEKLIESKRADSAVATYILSQPEWSHRPDLVKTLLERGTADYQIAEHILTQPEWKNHPEFVEKIIASKNVYGDWIANYLLQMPHWKKHPKLVEKLIDSKKGDPIVAQFILSQPEWRNRPDLVKTLLERGTADSQIAQYILTQPEWKNHPEFVEKLIESKRADTAVAQYILSQPEWSHRPDLVKTLLERGTADSQIAEYVLTQPAWKNHPELVERLIEKRTINPKWIENKLLQLPHWKERPELLEKLIAAEKPVLPKQPESPVTPPPPQSNPQTQTKQDNCVVKTLRRIFRKSISN